jgi:hypothetical protein
LTIITGELASREAAAQAGMDRSTIMASRKTAKDGAIAALQVLGPGRRRDAPGGQRAGSAAGGGHPVVLHDRRAGDRARGVARKIGLGLSGPVPQRSQGMRETSCWPSSMSVWPLGGRPNAAYAVLGVDRRRAHPGRPRPASRPTTHAQPTAPETAHDAVISLAACRAKSETPQRFTRAAARMPSPKALPS